MNNNYPNPFNSTTFIKFELPELANVQIVVYNSLGQKVAVLVNDNKPAGYHRVSWNGKNLNGSDVSSGIYFCQFKAKGIASGKVYQNLSKMVLMK
jgi:flagellar hook assembly protein FlgD